MSPYLRFRDCNDYRAENREGSWEFMKWHAGKDCQIVYSNEMVTTSDPPERYTANMHALEPAVDNSRIYSSPISSIILHVKLSRCYIIDRYTRFAFSTPSITKRTRHRAQRYIHIINAEITRKRTEFDLKRLRRPIAERIGRANLTV